MQDGARISGEDASRWLKEHFAGESGPQVNITWRDEEPDPVAYRRVLEILFRPRADSGSA